MGINTSGTLGRKPRRSGATSSPGPPSHLTERLKHKRHNVDSGYCTSSDDKRWSQEGDADKNWTTAPISVKTAEMNGAHSATSTPSTISPSFDTTGDDDLTRGGESERGDHRTIKDVNR